MVNKSCSNITTFVGCSSHVLRLMRCDKRRCYLQPSTKFVGLPVATARTDERMGIGHWVDHFTSSVGWRDNATFRRCPNSIMQHCLLFVVNRLIGLNDAHTAAKPFDCIYNLPQNLLSIIRAKHVYESLCSINTIFVFHVGINVSTTGTRESS